MCAMCTTDVNPIHNGPCIWITNNMANKKKSQEQKFKFSVSFFPDEYEYGSHFLEIF